ncbi:hypothetical protein DCC85_17400 [Paenibacillus sp. CAA11]|uniref:GerMN domain-containing protein n=1 Tax=Paenibacillus sp. CAA11 TaxID=1532905 RepID=UPI000D357F25|nr:GerMN domain-containing protein [Paenibacillus sp. CAA11]AWB45786.1 hypothetical protein DCC85_17400 [Paenibacillus sp. CAA11]
MKVLPYLRPAATAGILALLLSGCSFPGASPSAQIDPPPADVEAQMLSGLEDQVHLELSAKDETLTTVYVSNGQGLLVPVAIPLSSSQKDKRTLALQALVKNGPYQTKLPAGFTAVLPEGTEVQSLTVKEDEKLAVVEFTKPFAGYEAKDERKIIEAITWTLTSDPQVQNVEIWVEGQRLNEMPVDHTPLAHPLNRSAGINLELDQNVSLAQTRPVTLYFTATSSSGDPYFVPVTRLVPAGGDPVQAALGELLRGPLGENGLEEVLTTGAKLESVKTSKEGVVTVSLKDEMFENGDKLPAQMLQSVVLTVTENAKGSKVRIQLNGSEEVIGSDNQRYSDPVSKPAVINNLPV